MATPTTKRATYADVLAAPEHKIAEIVDGELHVSPRPANLANSVHSSLATELIPPFGRGRGGPGGWLLIVEPELHLPDGDVLVPDLAGWRRDRMAHVPDAAGIAIAPDWVCEVLSPSTERLDRSRKLRIYARWGVPHAWLVHPRHRTVEVLRLHADGTWLTLAVHQDDERVRAEPFDAIELDLANLWVDLPARVGEPAAEYAF